MDYNPYKAPQSKIEVWDEYRFNEVELAEISQYFRMTMMMFLSSLISWFLGWSVILIFLLAYLTSLFYLLKAIRSEFPWLYVLASIIPFVKWILLFNIIRRASKILKAHGYKITLLGAHKEDV